MIRPVHFRCCVGLALTVLAMAVCAEPAAPARCVTDDAAREVCLAQPAQRIVSLSPGATELLFDAGAGERVVGAVGFSDFPEAAKKIPRVGSYKRLDLERILALKPDLIIAWRSGNPRAQTERLESLGQTLYYSEPRRFDDVASTLQRFATLAGSEAVGGARAQRFRHGIDALAKRYRDAAPVSVFYEVWEEPLMTVNGEHLISQVIDLCGGRNVFADLPALTQAPLPQAGAGVEFEGQREAHLPGRHRLERLQSEGDTGIVEDLSTGKVSRQPVIGSGRQFILPDDEQVAGDLEDWDQLLQSHL